MNSKKFLLSLLLLIYVYSYDDCEHTTKKETDQYWFNNAWVVSNTEQKNLTFIASSADDCKGRNILKTEKRYDADVDTNHEYCCFYTYDNMEKYEKDYIGTNSKDGKVESQYDSIKGKCISLTKYQYDNIKDYIFYEQLRDNDIKNLKIDCSSYNIEFFILSLVLVFLL